MRDPVLRNLEITHCYWRLAQAVARRTGVGANWCTFATWASRQAGSTIRGEDAEELLRTPRSPCRGPASDPVALALAAPARPA